MQTSISKMILAIVTIDETRVNGGGAPIFKAKDQTEQDIIATTIARVTEGIVHELDNGLYIVVKH